MGEPSPVSSWTISNEELLRKQFPLHRACRDGDIETLTSLLANEDPNVYEEDGFYSWTPTHWASYYGKMSCLMRLIEHGSSCDVPTERFNQSPAHIAAYAGHGHCLKWLLHCGALMNRQDYLGETPIHKAARAGKMECVSLLVSQGVKLSMRNYSGHTPSQLAALCNFPECATYLERASQIQQQALGVYDELRIPVTHHCTNPLNHSALNGHCHIREGNSHTAQAINGGLIPCSVAAGCCPAESGSMMVSHESMDRCHDDMDVGEAEINVDACGDHVVSATHVFGKNGFMHMNHNGFTGHKRLREDMDEVCSKRARHEGSLWTEKSAPSSLLTNGVANHYNLSAVQNCPSPVEAPPDREMHQSHDFDSSPVPNEINHNVYFTSSQGYYDPPLKCKGLSAHFV